MAKKNQKKGTNRHIYILSAVLVVLIIVAFAGYFKLKSFDILARYKGGKIERSEFITNLKIEADRYDPLIWKKPTESMRVKESILNRLIEEHLLLAKAKELGIDVTTEEMESEIKSFKSGYDDATFNKMLELKGLKYNDWIETKKRKLLIQKLVKLNVIDKMKIGPEDIKKYYNGHEQEFNLPEQVRARHILVNSWDEAQRIMELINQGENFAALAKNRSISPERWDGGDLGYFGRGSHPDVFDKVCFSLAVGEVSPIVKSEYGYHIFKLIDKKPAQRESLEDAKEKIVMALQQQKSGDTMKDWYKSIYDAAGVEINNELLKKIEVTINDEEETN